MRCSCCILSTFRIRLLRRVSMSVAVCCLGCPAIGDDNGGEGWRGDIDCQAFGGVPDSASHQPQPGSHHLGGWAKVTAGCGDMVTILSRKKIRTSNRSRYDGRISSIKGYLSYRNQIATPRNPSSPSPRSPFHQPWETCETTPSSLTWTLSLSGLKSLVTIEPGSMTRACCGSSVLQKA